MDQLQEVTLQNFVPHRRYKRRGAGADRDRGGNRLEDRAAHGPRRPGDRGRRRVTLKDMVRLVGEARRVLAADGVALTERLCVYAHIDPTGSVRRSRHHQNQVLVVHHAPRLRAPVGATSGRWRSPKARNGEWPSEDELTALLSETRRRRTIRRSHEAVASRRRRRDEQRSGRIPADRRRDLRASTL
jgi:hypothetical protein